MASSNATTTASTRLRDLLDGRERTAVWLARRSGIHYDKVLRILQGRPITLDEALALSRVLGVPVETFAGEERAE